MLKPSDRKVVVSVIDYFIRTTGRPYDVFCSIFTDVVQHPEKTRGKEVTYSYWLLGMCCEQLKEQYSISLDSCIEELGTLGSLVAKAQATYAGEQMTPKVWGALGWLFISKVLDYKDTITYWDMTCGTGTLEDAVADKENYNMYLSTVNAEDVKKTQERFGNASVFELDITQNIDIDEDNTFFSDKLPVSLQDKLKANAPMVIYMHLPHKRSNAIKDTDIADAMSNIGLKKYANNLYAQVLYRLIMLKQTYGLTNLTVGIISTAEWLEQFETNKLTRLFFTEFEYISGFGIATDDICGRDANAYNNELSCMTVWRAKERPELELPRIVLDTYQQKEGRPQKHGTQLITKDAQQTMLNWCLDWQPKTERMLPRLETPTSLSAGLLPEFRSTLMYVETDTTVGTTKHLGICAFPNTNTIPMTANNMEKCLVFLGTRAALLDIEPTFDSQCFMSPTESIEGWNTYKADCIVLALFGMQSQSYSYRGIKDTEGNTWIRNNNVFPLSIEECKQIIEDRVLLQDMETYPSNNADVLQLLNELSPYMSVEATNLYIWSLNVLRNSLKGLCRAQFQYASWSLAYDASINQLRSIEGFWTDALTKEMYTLTSALRSSIRSRVCKFGILKEAI